MIFLWKRKLAFKELDPIYKDDYEDNGFDDDRLEDGPGYWC